MLKGQEPGNPGVQMVHSDSTDRKETQTAVTAGRLFSPPERSSRLANVIIQDHRNPVRTYGIQLRTSAVRLKCWDTRMAPGFKTHNWSAALRPKGYLKFPIIRDTCLTSYTVPRWTNIIIDRFAQRGSGPRRLRCHSKGCCIVCSSGSFPSYDVRLPLIRFFSQEEDGCPKKHDVHITLKGKNYLKKIVTCYSQRSTV